MRSRFNLLVGALVMTLTATALAACVVSGPAVQTPTGAAPLPLGIDPATFVTLEFDRNGGIAGFDDQARLYLDGHVVLTRRQGQPVTFTLTEAEQAQLTAALEDAQFYRRAAQSTPPAAPFPDAFQYRIERRGMLLQGEVITQDGEIPDWLAPVLPLLTGLLLNPDPARTQPYDPAATLTPSAAITATATAQDAAPDVVLLEFVRTSPDEAVRLLVNLNRTYSLARDGAVETGELTREEMAALLKLLETADFKTRAGDFTSPTPCTGCVRYEITYRNLLGAWTAQGEAGALPAWMQILADTLEDAFLAAPVAANATPVITATLAAPTAEATTIAPTLAPTAPVDPSQVVVVEFDRTGGFAGFDDHAKVYLDGYVVLERAGTRTVTFQLSESDMERLTRAFEDADFFTNASQTPAPIAAIPDAFQYRVARYDNGAYAEVVTQDGETPDWLAPLLSLLTDTLLNGKQ